MINDKDFEELSATLDAAQANEDSVKFLNGLKIGSFVSSAVNAVGGAIFKSQITAYTKELLDEMLINADRYAELMQVVNGTSRYLGVTSLAALVAAVWSREKAQYGKEKLEGHKADIKKMYYMMSDEEKALFLKQDKNHRKLLTRFVGRNSQGEKSVDERDDNTL